MIKTDFCEWRLQRNTLDVTLVSSSVSHKQSCHNHTLFDGHICLLLHSHTVQIVNNNHKKEYLQDATFECYKKGKNFKKLATKFKFSVVTLHKYYNLWVEQVLESKVVHHKDVHFSMGQYINPHIFAAEQKQVIGDDILHYAKNLTPMFRGAVKEIENYIFEAYLEVDNQSADISRGWRDGFLKRNKTSKYCL